jgi:hypothetical protein
MQRLQGRTCLDLPEDEGTFELATKAHWPENVHISKFGRISRSKINLREDEMRRYAEFLSAMHVGQTLRICYYRVWNKGHGFW